MIIIGIDPGSRITGYGIIRLLGNQSHHIASGCIRITADNVSTRLLQIFTGLQSIIQQYQPMEAAIEQVFMHQNPGSALKLGQARGAAMVALAMPVAEYSARQVKQSVVGYGAAKKEQVQHMVNRLLNLSGKLQADTADALAVALCHAHSRLNLPMMATLASSVKKKRQTWRDYQPDR
ncbi:MAG TPA: crossover junction endodeoxyribonuclease RuvC [Patescibacteria group bacterium]|jgi:crossover junction endodeoxyribonuclease RuvC|nr:crossover junction endodeoxyribonuclease RuvC [Patescibacteria group bacterium]